MEQTAEEVASSAPLTPSPPRRRFVQVAVCRGRLAPPLEAKAAKERAREDKERRKKVGGRKEALKERAG